MRTQLPKIGRPHQTDIIYVVGVAAAVLPPPWATGLQSDGRDLSLFLRERVERGRQSKREGFEFIFVLTNCPSLSRLAWRGEERANKKVSSPVTFSPHSFVGP